MAADWTTTASKLVAAAAASILMAKPEGEPPNATRGRQRFWHRFQRGSGEQGKRDDENEDIMFIFVLAPI